MQIGRAEFVAVFSLRTGCASATTHAPAKPISPGQVRSEHVHERNEREESRKGRGKGGERLMPSRGLGGS